jgi:RNA polymerase sigma-70 factor (ECF subfamily)
MDVRLVEGMRAGAPWARAALYRDFHQRVLAYLSVLLADRDVLWDLTHDVFVKAYEAGSRFEGEPAAVAPWLLAIARNAAFDHLRAAQRVASEEPLAIDRRIDQETPHGGPEWGENSAVHHAVGSLPYHQREVLVLHYREDRDAADIGRALGKSADAVRHIERRALQTIRGQLVPTRRAAPY